MYQRKYYPQDEIRIPENYGGYALTEEASEAEEVMTKGAFVPESTDTGQIPVEEEYVPTVGAHPWETEERVEPTAHLPTPRKKKEPLLDGVTGIVSRLGLHLPSLKLEDLLLIGIGLSLLLSKERDVEYGLLLLGLVFL